MAIREVSKAARGSFASVWSGLTDQSLASVSFWHTPMKIPTEKKSWHFSRVLSNACEVSWFERVTSVKNQAHAGLSVLAHFFALWCKTSLSRNIFWMYSMCGWHILANIWIVLSVPLSAAGWLSAPSYLWSVLIEFEFVCSFHNLYLTKYLPFSDHFVVFSEILGWVLSN